MKKAQAAMEFLTTYGWVFLVISAAAGAFVYIIGLDQTDKIPATCQLGMEFACGSFAANNHGVLYLEFKNLVGKTITIPYVQFEINGIKHILNYTGKEAATLSIGESVVISTRPVSQSNQLYTFDSSMQKIGITIYYKTDDVDSLPKSVIGEIFVPVVESVDPYGQDSTITLIPRTESIFISADGTRTVLTIDGDDDDGPTQPPLVLYCDNDYSCGPEELNCAANGQVCEGSFPNCQCSQMEPDIPGTT
ncbi:MAG: hypothetical protein PHU51_04325 [Candidatus Nanoarchaeia archaeon]|nr:hypothetical protein [Candidatus Nanoarchaeia archaeon]